VINDPKAEGELAGIRVVAAYAGGSPDLPASRDRVAGFTRQLRDELHVEIVDSIEALLGKVDVVLLESVDGRKHLEQAEPVLKAHKPVFIDKPIAGSLADAVRIYELAERSGTPCFSSSSLRYGPAIRGLRSDPKVGEILGCDAYGPCPLEEHHPDLFWYGIHGVESLFTVMGTGCVSVTRVRTEGTELVVGTWEGGRVGTFRGIRRGKAEYGALAFGASGIAHAQGDGGYTPLLVEICKFFRTGRPPVEAKETLEIFAFMGSSRREQAAWRGAGDPGERHGAGERASRPDARVTE
jgi:predicted dehydrogenase